MSGGRPPIRRTGLVTGLVAAALVAVITGCGQSVDRVPPAEVPNGNPQRGPALLRSYGCVSCHTVAGVRGADGPVGPPLSNMGARTYIAGELPNTGPNLQRWIRDPQGVEPGTAMPDLGVSERDARDLAAYLLSRR